MKRQFRAVVTQEGDRFVAQCLDVDVASQGETEPAALANLQEALALHFTPPLATAMPHIHTIEVDIAAA